MHLCVYKYIYSFSHKCIFTIIFFRDHWHHASLYNNLDLAKSTKAHHRRSTLLVSLPGSVCTSDDLWCCVH